MTPTDNDNNDAAPVVASTSADFAADAKPKRTRRNLGRLKNDPDPAERHFIMDGKPVVAVALGGRLGVGKEMILDADEWDWIALALGRAWGVVRHGGARRDGTQAFYVGSGRSRVAPFARQASRTPVLVLSRWITRAPRNAQVRHANGNSLDLRRRNLVVTETKQRSHVKGLPLPPLSSFMRPAVSEAQHAV